ncbi:MULTISPECIES: hypothetical protein, partial [unclassified Bartonella]|uniref:hypothetical protein n=1 Tax=unclassified Bartonella TaxID=2645622 RepID=UPI0035CEF735
ELFLCKKTLQPLPKVGKALFNALPQTFKALNNSAKPLFKLLPSLREIKSSSNDVFPTRNGGAISTKNKPRRVSVMVKRNTHVKQC